MEQHQIIGPAWGEPRLAPHTGACVRLPLGGAPSARWSRTLSAHLAARLTGPAQLGHLKLDAVVQGSTIVLEGVERGEADRLGPALREAIAAANLEGGGEDGGNSPALNMDHAQAEAVARAVSAGAG